MLSFYKNFYIYSLYFTNYKLQVVFLKFIQSNNLFLYIQQSQFILLNKINTLDLHFNNISCIDISNFLKTPLVSFYAYNNYINYCQYVMFLKNLTKLYSISNFFQNSVFLERENMEMFNYCFVGSVDTRNLLLDYTFLDNPMLKYFNVEGFKEVYLNVFTNNLQLTSINYIEL